MERFCVTASMLAGYTMWPCKRGVDELFCDKVICCSLPTSDIQPRFLQADHLLHSHAAVTSVPTAMLRTPLSRSSFSTD